MKKNTTAKKIAGSQQTRNEKCAGRKMDSTKLLLVDSTVHIVVAARAWSDKSLITKLNLSLALTLSLSYSGSFQSWGVFLPEPESVCIFVRNKKKEGNPRQLFEVTICFTDLVISYDKTTAKKRPGMSNTSQSALKQWRTILGKNV